MARKEMQELVKEVSLRTSVLNKKISDVIREEFNMDALESKKLTGASGQVNSPEEMFVYLTSLQTVSAMLLSNVFLLNHMNGGESIDEVMKYVKELALKQLEKIKNEIQV
jgi:L-rhamnose isomerase